MMESAVLYQQAQPEEAMGRGLGGHIHAGVHFFSRAQRPPALSAACTMLCIDLSFCFILTGF